MSRLQSVARLLDSGVVAILRLAESDRLVKVAEALHEGGLEIIEVTMTVPHALDVLRDVHDRIGDRVLLGAGTVLDTESARAAIDAGAAFIVSPVVNLELIRFCLRYNVPVLPGAYTPTEVVTAWEAGADIVKIFPAESGGPAHLKALKGPLPQVRMMPTGGVTLETLPEFVKAGACAVGVGGSLLDKTAIAEDRYEVLTENAAKMLAAWRECPGVG